MFDSIDNHTLLKVVLITFHTLKTNYGNYNDIVSGLSFTERSYYLDI
jgi:hypothetical protein